MSNEKIFDRIFDDIVNEAASIATENIGRNMVEPEAVEFSKEHEAEMQRIFRKERKKWVHRKAAEYLKRVAIFLLIVMIVSGVAVFSVEAWRIKTLNFILEMSQTHSEINFEEGNAKGESYTSDGITLAYIPKGYKLEKKDIKNDMGSLVFKGKEHYFVFSVSDITNSIGIDTENASFKKTTINGQEALFSSNNNVNILVWHDEIFSYTLSGTVEENEILKIAKNIKK